jgi:Interferon-alpha/beta receptor, fibronectin type III
MLLKPNRKETKMTTTSKVTAFLAALASIALMASKLALACDAPGTPNNEAVVAIGHGTLHYFFDNTARVSKTSRPGDPLKMRMYFDINMKERGGADEWTYIENDGPHALEYQEKMEYTIAVQQTRHINPANFNAQHVDRPLQPNKTYCFRVWARTEGGCRSDSSSSWTCGTVQP